jgi:DNA-binding NarL/FixJ family response regulator
MNEVNNRATKPRQKVHRVVVVDDHPVVRSGLVNIIAAMPNVEVCGEAETGAAAVEMSETLQPDMIVLDIGLKDSNGLELIKQMKARCEDVRILVCSMRDESLFAERALNAGAAGYLQKDEDSEQIREAVRRVLDGKVHVSDTITSQLVRRAATGENTAASDPVDCLSDRELEVFELIGRGWTTKRIAKSLHLSSKTIDTYRMHIKQKLQLETTSELTVHAANWMFERGLHA